MFAKDRDLLTLEPALLREARFAGQTLAAGSAIAGGSTLTLYGADLVGAGVAAGMIAEIGGVGLEILGVSSAETADVSLIRDVSTDPARRVPELSGTATICTFRPQIEIVHRQLLAMLGLSPGATGGEGALGEDRVTNASELVLLEALGALHLVLSGASATLGPASSVGERAEHYKARFSQERWRAVARIDTDADGAADAVRRFNVMTLTRG